MVTTDDSYAGRIFTMFHEYAHLVRRSASYCAVDSADTESTERWCDHFAAAFLMPRDEMLRLKDERAYRELGPDDWSMNDIERAARAFRVSPFAMARRLRDLGIATFFTRHGDELWQRDQLARRAPRPDQRGGGPASPLSAVRELGTAAAGAITEGLHRGLVDRTEFVTILGIRGNQLSDFETRLSEQRRRESA
jgi:Zn-dependent peptidase ImmA (M78 family)